MKPDRDSVVPTPASQRAEDFKRRWIPVIVWGAAALLCLVLMTNRVNRSEYIGLALATSYEISAAADGKLEAVVFDAHEDVRAGDVVAKLDDSLLAARIATSTAAIGELQARLDAARAELAARTDQERNDWTADLRRFQAEEQRRRLESLELRVQIEGDEIELERLALELQRAIPLLETGLIGQSEFDQTKLAHDALRARLDENRIFLSSIEDALADSVARRREFERNLPAIPPSEPLLRPLEQAVEVETRRLNEIEIERQALLLRSPIAGRVGQVLCRRGQAIVAGEPIMTITERDVQEVVAWLREGDGSDVGASSEVLLSSRSSPGRSAESVVLRVGAELELMPPRLWRDPARPDYGRAVVIAAAPALDLTPGELIDVSFRRR